MSKNVFQDHLAVIDLETLAVGSDAPILSLGVTISRYDDRDQTFDSLVQNGLYLKFDLKEQLDRGRKASQRVVKWWYDQSPEARKVLIPNPTLDVSLYGLEAHLQGFFKDKGIDIKKVDWYDRNCFDLSKLQYLFEEDLDQDVIWNYHNTFDVATAFRFMGYDRYAGVRVSDFKGATYHNALHDAAVDHMRIFKCLHSDIAD
jgi:hypothetical protein